MDRFKKFLPKKSLVMIVGFILCVSSFILGRGFFQDHTPTYIEPISDDMQDSTTTTASETASICFVDIKGEIVKPGVYQLTKGMRIIHVIEQAGGFTETADQSQINLAAEIEDGMMVYVPKLGEIENVQGNSNRMIEALSPSSQTENKVNINTASQDQLETLVGIGPAKAQAIIKKREEVGRFKSIEELLDVNGIGQKSFEKLKDHICVN